MRYVFALANVRIPRSSPSRGERSYAQLILRVLHHPRVRFFDGPLFRCGQLVDESELRPTPDAPLAPLLIEYAGNDRSGWGHRRSNDIHILWRYDAARADWVEIARTLSQGPEWKWNLAPIVRRELGSVAPAPNFVAIARASTDRVLEILDGELDQFDDEGRARVLSFLYDAFTARLMSAPDAPTGYY